MAFSHHNSLKRGSYPEKESPIFHNSVCLSLDMTPVIVVALVMKHPRDLQLGSSLNLNELFPLFCTLKAGLVPWRSC